ncbi:hypothetical protein CO174_03950 [Candidatus Uhrbacteria bacterium CG_4_9_14_3_um_filter_50_9]|uniref:Glycosyl transferase family 1 domain-containing protein n=1 Tax=Candidatus Uhrbacteria bacterium CG_4_9_14_3_um_filter_50_9 TaxID=1975035 RepID=A0A2M7XBT1_9BACT|nr:MAG: hypothetical protein CO174_03950 [Candidatus Uhrbacteria bacterium CG_4_9_14_3_um_filter_50_9]
MKTGTKRRTLGFFFTRGVSLQTWDRIGNLSREIALYNSIAEHLKHIYFFTYGDKQDLTYQHLLRDNITIIPKQLPIPNVLYMLLLPFLTHAQMKTCDLFQTNQMKGGLAALIGKWRYRKPLIVRCGYEWLFASEKRGTVWWKKQLVKWIEQIVYTHANAIIVTSTSIKEFVEHRFPYLQTPIHLIPNYIDTQLFCPGKEQRQKNTICFVGKLEQQKNLFELIEALGNMPTTLEMYGEGPLKKDLQVHAEQHQTNVRFHGRIPNEELPRKLNQCEIFILPSLYEGNPKALLEAMACGLPVIGTNVEGIRELIVDDQNGLLCESSHESIRGAVTTLLEHPHKAQLGKAARNTIEEGFSLPTVTEQFLDCYESVQQNNTCKPKYRIFLIGKDGRGWSIDQDRAHTEKLLKRFGYQITRNPFHATHLWCVWLDLLMRPRYRWVLLLRKYLKKKIVGVVTNDITQSPEKLPFVQTSVDVCVAPSQPIEQWLRAGNVRTTRIPFYVDPQIFYPLNQSKDILAQQLHIDPQAFENVFVIGSFQRDSLGANLTQPKWQKNPELLVQILKQLPKERILLLLAGPRRHYLVRRCKEEGIPYVFVGDNTPHTTETDDYPANTLSSSTMNTLYNLCDLYIITSKSEGGPKAVMEAALAGIPVISTDVGLAKDLLHPTLIYKDAHSAAALVNALLENSSALNRETMESRKTIEQELSDETLRKKFKEVLES